MKRFLLVLVCLVVLPVQAAEIKATALYYRMSEPGIDPYLSRWLITDKYLRIDEGDAADNYILVDRRKRTVYSVVHGDQTILEIPYRAMNKTPAIALTLQSKGVQNDKLPVVEGKKPVYRELSVNDKLCYSVVSVEKILPDAVKAMREYRQIMAGEHAKNLDNTPLELQQPCELALFIFHPEWIMEKGLPIQEWDVQGKAQALLNYKQDERVANELFLLPQGYRRYQTLSGQEGQGGE